MRGKTWFLPTKTITTGLLIINLPEMHLKAEDNKEVKLFDEANSWKEHLNFVDIKKIDKKNIKEN
jgi:hypothetical protein